MLHILFGPGGHRGLVGLAICSDDLISAQLLVIRQITILKPVLFGTRVVGFKREPTINLFPMFLPVLFFSFLILTNLYQFKSLLFRLGNVTY